MRPQWLTIRFASLPHSACVLGLIRAHWGLSCQNRDSSDTRLWLRG